MADEKRDWVGEAVKCFITDVPGVCPTDPVAAIRTYFERTASDELKAACAAQGKTAEGCWKFLEACALKALHGRNGHIDPSTVFAIAMHWFQDVPADWECKPKAMTNAEFKRAEANGFRSDDPRDVEAARRSMEIAKKKRREVFIEVTGKPPPEEDAAAPEPKKEAPKAEKPKPKAERKRKPKPSRQSFFFELLESREGAGDGE